MKKIIFVIVLLSFSTIIFGQENKNENQKIQVALLLDTSNSMDGLIDQAKSRLWNIVNTLSTLKFNGKAPVLEIALYEYGNDYIPIEKNFVRQITPLANDLDVLSQKLFALKTNGGSEYCGAVIYQSLKDLQWDNNKNSMKLIYIAGNESFDQGNIKYATVLKSALEKEIYVNTIFCGDKEEGISLLWQDGAVIGKGVFFNINSNQQITYISTPYDKDIEKCNTKLNATYFAYGRNDDRKTMQEQQDIEAVNISAGYKAERTVSKANQNYVNAQWDIIDLNKQNTKALDALKKEDLPKELQNKTKEEIKTFIAEKTKEREAIQKEIGKLATLRQEYINAKNTKNSVNKEDDLGVAIINSILTLAKEKGYTY
jgi:predicted house-cleaning noncanonical NTP pyrophosphatase (MazG superfamily)